MGYPVRFCDPDAIHFITSRTVGRTLFMVPTPAVTNAIGAALACMQQRHAVEIYEFVVLSNHFHLCARAPGGNLSDFMRDLNSAIALAVNRCIGRRGVFWGRRYIASPILDEDAQVERAMYIYGHGVKEGLVDRPEQWPGVASLKERMSGKVMQYDLVDHTAMSRAAFRTKRRQRLADFTTRVTLRLSPWPFLEGLTEDQTRTRIAGLVAQACAGAAELRGGRRALGVKRVLEQDPLSQPEPSESSPHPICHASTPQRRREYRSEYVEFVHLYREASKRFRDGDSSVTFPPHSYRPPLPRGWEPGKGANRQRPGGQ